MGWRDNLDETGVLPDAGKSDKNELWLKLQKRLHHNKRSHAWVWITAAASVVAILLLPMVIEDEQPSTIAAAGKTKGLQTKAPGTNTAQTTVVAVPITLRPKEVNKQVKYANMQKSSEVTTSIIVKDTPVKIIVTAPEIAGTIAETNAMKVPAVSVSFAANKNLQVVHINELGYNQETPLPLTRADRNRLIRFGLAKANKSPGSAVAGSISFNIPSKKNSTN